MVYEVSLVRFTKGRDESPKRDGSILVKRIAMGKLGNMGYATPDERSDITFDYDLAGTSGTDVLWSATDRCRNER